MKKIIIFAILIIAFLFTSSAYAGEVIYSKPAFHGRVIDTDTKQPIEEAVVVVLYHKRSTFSLNPGGTSAYVTKAKETLTDKNGEFYFPAYSETMFLNEAVDTQFIFFKPGYMSGYGPTNINPTLIEKYFSADVIGKEAEIETGSFDDSSYVKWKGPLGILELKNTNPNESMSGSMPYGFTKKDLPLLYNAIEEDDMMRGLLPRGGRKK